MRRRQWNRIQERVGVVIFLLLAIAVMLYIALLLYDFFTTYQPPPR